MREKCPSPGALRSFLEGRVGPGADAVARHIDGCERCQAHLDALDPWPTLGGPPDNPLPEVDPARLSAFLRAIEVREGGNGPGGPGHGATAPEPPPIPGSVLGDYQLIRQIGGNLGIVFEAVHLGRGSRVALKVSGTADRARFALEQEAAARVSHPHVVAVLESPPDDPGVVPYFVMELVDGGTLRDLIAEQRVLEPRDAAELVRQVATGLDAVHAAGLVHRDVKPENILLEGGGGWAKLGDFGLAAEFDERAPRITRPGFAVGTVFYMAPERLGTAAGPPDPRGDVYSLGAVLYELLTGQPPFLGASPEAVRQCVLHDDPRPPRRTPGVQVPRALDTVVLKCLEKRPEHRYARACDLAADLDRFLRGQPIRSRRASSLARASRWARRRPERLALFASVAALTIGGVVGAALYVRSTTQIVHAYSALKRERKQSIRVEQAFRLREAYEFWKDGDTAKVRDLFTRYPSDVDTDPEGLAFAWSHLERVSRGGGSVLHMPGCEPICMAFAVDGVSLAVGASDGKVRIWDTQTPAARVLGSVGGEGRSGAVRWVGWVEQGQAVAAADDARVTVWDAGSGRTRATYSFRAVAGLRLAAPAGELPVLVTEELVGDGESPTRVQLVGRQIGTERERFRLSSVGSGHGPVACSPDGRFWAFARHNRTTEVWDLATGDDPKPQFVEIDAEILTFAPGGWALAGAGGDGRVAVWHRETGQITMLGNSGGRVLSMAFAPDGGTLFTGDQGAVILCRNAHTGELLNTLMGHTAPVVSLVVDPGGSKVVSAGRDGEARLWDPAARPNASALAPMLHPGGSVAFNPDGRRVAVTSRDRSVRVFALPDWTEVGEPILCPARVNGLAFAPDGTLAAACEDRTVRVWEDNGQRPRTLAHPDPVMCVAFSADGRWAGAGGRSGRVVVWDRSAGWNARVITAHPGTPVRGLAFSSGATFRTAGDRRVVTWDTASGTPLARFDAPSPVVAMAVNPGGELCALALGDGKVAIGSGSEARLTIDAGVARSVTFLDRRQVAVGGDDGTVRIFDTATGRLVDELDGHGDRVLSIAVSPEGSSVVTVGRDGTLRAWRQSLARLSLPGVPGWTTGRPLGGPAGDVRALGFTPDGRRVVSAVAVRVATARHHFPLKRRSYSSALAEAGDGVGLTVRDSDGATQVSVPKGQPVVLMEAASLSRDHRWASIGYAGGLVAVYDVASGREARRFFLSPDAERHYRLAWEALRRMGVPTMPKFRQHVRAIAVSCDGALVATVDGDGGVAVWDQATGRHRRGLDERRGDTSSLVFAPDSRTLAMISGPRVRLWDWETNRCESTLTRPGASPRCIEFSPDGAHLAVGYSDGAIQLLDLNRQGAAPQWLVEHVDAVMCLAFSPGGRALASGSDDRTVRLWDLKTTLEVARLDGHSGPVSQVAFSPDGLKLVSCGKSQVWAAEILLWK